jgi:nucleotide-binding universal stress UspA family protein
VKDLRSSASGRLVELMRIAHAPGEAIVTQGMAGSDIAGAARELRASLIVLGALGRSGRLAGRLGSTARAVIRDAPCSVLIKRRARARASC